MQGSCKFPILLPLPYWHVVFLYSFTCSLIKHRISDIFQVQALTVPKEHEMRAKDKYTVFNRSSRGFRKGVHKVPKFTRVSSSPCRYCMARCRHLADGNIHSTSPLAVTPRKSARLLSKSRSTIYSTYMYDHLMRLSEPCFNVHFLRSDLSTPP